MSPIGKIRPPPVRGGSSPSDPGIFFMTFTFPGHGNRREGILKYVKRRDSAGGLNLNTGSNVIVWLAGESARDPDFFGPMSSFPTRVHVTRTGIYRVTYGVNALSSGAADAGSIKTFISKNSSGSDLVGSMSGFTVPITASTHGSAFSSFIIDLVSGDYLEIYAIREGAPTGTINTIQGGSFMQVELVSLTDSAELLGTQQYVERDGRIEKVTITKGVSGYSGSTYFDVLRNGVTLVGSTKLAIASGENFKEYNVPSSLNRNVAVGDLVTVDVVSDETPYARDICVIVKCRAAR
jgi:hypothetical protein